MSKITTNNRQPEGQLHKSEPAGLSSALSNTSFVDPLQTSAPEPTPKTASFIAKKWAIAESQEMGRIFPDTGASITITKVSSKREVA